MFYNAMGLKCPEPLLVLQRALKESGPDEATFIESDDINAVKTFTAYCEKNGLTMDWKISFRVRKP